MMTSLDDFLNNEGKELPKEKQIPQSSLKLPKGAMSIFIDENNEAVYRYDLNCYINSNEDAITSLIYLLRLKDYLENAFLVENSKVKPTYISKAYDDDIFVIVKADIEKTIEQKIKFEELIVKIAVYPNKYIDVKDLSDYEPEIPNEIVDEAISRKDFCFVCGVPLEQGYKCYHTLKKPINEGAIVCINCLDSLSNNDYDAKTTFEKTNKKQEEVAKDNEEPIIETNEEQEESKENEVIEEDKEEQIENEVAEENEEPIVENEEVEEKEDKKQETIIEAKPIRIHFNNGKEFIEHLKLLKTIDDEAWFKITNEGLQYSQMDASRISALFMKFKGEIENFKECKFSIYLDEFLRVISNEDLKQMKDLTFEVDLANRKTKFLSSIDMEGDITLEEEYNEYSDFPEPKAILNAEVEVDLNSLLNSIKGFDTAKLILEKGERLFIEARKENIKKKTFIPSKIAKGGNEESIYDVNFLSNFLKRAIKLKKIAKIGFSNKMPLNIKFETSIAEISYWLAPRVEEQ
jgi:hypothetical protein